MSKGPIPGQAIRSYINTSGIYDPESFTQIIRAMDRAYMGLGQGEGKTFSRDMLKR